MKVSAILENSHLHHRVEVRTNEQVQELSIPGKPTGRGVAVNGGELLFLALATCFCNDIYREAARQQINITRVHVEVSGDFEAEGQPGENIVYRASLEGDASAEELKELIKHTDQVAEIQNTLRQGVKVEILE
jgi:uncharacterized OsmC-like protein